MKGPIYLVCISCTEEPYESLRGQLELIYGQVGFDSSPFHLPSKILFRINVLDCLNAVRF